MSDVSVELLQQEIKTLKETCTELKTKVLELERNQTQFLILQTETKEQIKNLDATNKELKKSIADLNVLLNDLASKPGKRWDHLVMTLIGGVVVGIIGYVMGKLNGK